jgi:hypothetical protein
VIYEMRTYLLKPDTVPKVEEMFGEMIAARAKLSPIAGFWRTEVGTLNQIIHIWPYQSLDERDRIRAEAVKTGVWPPKVGEFILDMESKILHPAPFSPAFEPGEYGGLYEFRTYFYGPGAIPKVIEAWAPCIKERAALSPLIFVGFTDIGGLNQWVHVWAYKDMGERQAKRAESRKLSQWPPPRPEGAVPHRQENTLAIPAKWSPSR